MVMIAIGTEREPVSIIADVEDIQGRRIKFWVINGLWTGYFEDGVVTVDETKAQIDGQAITYVGEQHYGDYNAECIRVREEIRTPGYVLPTFEDVYRLWEQDYSDARSEDVEDDVAF
jgi:hypothetical protein